MLSPGTRLGTFEVLGPLGAGGMGEVYRAADTRLKREVALKILPEAFAQDPGRLARFEREARLLASVNHPGLAAIYGLEQEGPIRYIVMELVPGETLAETLLRGPLPRRDALLIARQIAEALEAAHERGVVHRDLKPSNIKVTPAGKVKVLDLGLAKAMDPVSDPSDASHSPTAVLDQTRPGVILGTAEFMSPEQARGKPLDKRTDIWSFGCVFFEMLSGQRPFSGETISDVIAAILSAEPPWTVLPEATPPRIQDLLRRCLEKDLAKRLRDAGDATIEIDQSLAEIGSGGAQAPRTPAPAAAAPPSRSSAPAATRRRAAAPAILAAAVVLGAIAGWFVLRSRQHAKARPAAGSLVVLPSRDLSGAPGGQLIGDAFVEMLSVRLGQVPGVQVVTPVAAIAASDAQSDPLQAARSVGARMAVRSSIMRSGDALRILYSVWDVETRRQIAGGQIDGPASDLFGIQDRLLDRIAADLNIEWPGDRGRTPTPPGLATATQQERYLQAIGSLQRADKAPSVDEAVRLLEGLAADAPGSALVHAALGRAYLARYSMTREKSWAERARAEAESARRLDPAPGEVDVTLGSTLLLAGERDRAEEAFRRALAARPSNADALVGLGRAREKAGDSAAAEQNYRKAIELQPFLFTPYNQLGGLYFERGRYAEAADVYRRLTRITPDSYSAFNNLGGSLSMTCDFDRAADAYRRALEIRPTHGSAASNVGMNQLWRGRYAEAVPSLERAAQYAPNNFEIWANLGDAYRAAGAPAEKSAAAYARSIALATESLSVQPKDAAAHSFLATCYAKTGRPGVAEEHRRQALALDDKNPNVLLDAAVVSALAGRRAEAVEWVRKAVDSGYCPGILPNQPELASLKEDPAFKAIITAPRKAAGS